MKTECSLSTRLPLSSLSVSVSLRGALCGQAVCASMLVIRTNRDEGGRTGYTPRTREGRMKEHKNKGKSNSRHEGNARELLLLVHTYFHRELYHFKALKGVPHHNTPTREIVSFWEEKKQNINSNSSPYQISFPPEGLEDEKRKKKERHSKDCNRLVMNKTLHQNWKDGEISFLSAC